MFELFVKNNTKGRDGITPNANFKRTYGEISAADPELINDVILI